MLLQDFSVIIDRCISAPGHGREVIDVLNSTYKRFLLQLMSNVKLLGEKIYNTQMVMHSATSTDDVSLAR